MPRMILSQTVTSWQGFLPAV